MSDVVDIYYECRIFDHQTGTGLLAQIWSQIPHYRRGMGSAPNTGINVAQRLLKVLNLTTESSMAQRNLPLPNGGTVQWYRNRPYIVFCLCLWLVHKGGKYNVSRVVDSLLSRVKKIVTHNLLSTLTSLNTVLSNSTRFIQRPSTTRNSLQWPTSPSVKFFVSTTLQERAVTALKIAGHVLKRRERSSRRVAASSFHVAFHTAIQ